MLNPTTQAFNVEVSPNDSTRSDLGQGNHNLRLPEPVAKFHKGTSKTKPFATSVKGKKDYACARASSHSPSLAATSKGISSSKLDWSSSISKLQSMPNGEFNFCSPVRNDVGDQHQWLESGNSKGNHRRDQSPTYPHHGMVKLQATQGMEISIPLDSGECSIGIPSCYGTGMGNDDQSLVEVHVRHLGSGRIEETGMELHS